MLAALSPYPGIILLDDKAILFVPRYVDKLTNAFTIFFNANGEGLLSSSSSQIRSALVLRPCSRPFLNPAAEPQFLYILIMVIGKSNTDRLSANESFELLSITITFSRG